MESILRPRSQVDVCEVTHENTKKRLRKQECVSISIQPAMSRHQNPPLTRADDYVQIIVVTFRLPWDATVHLNVPEISAARQEVDKWLHVPHLVIE